MNNFFKNLSKGNLFTSTRVKLDIIASIFLSFILSFFSYTVYRLLTLDIIYQISPVFKNSDIASYVDADILFKNFIEQTVFLLIVLDIIIFFISIFLFDRLVKNMLSPIEYLSNIQKKFAENVSHELRTPLSIINMHSEILLDNLEKESAKKDEKNISLLNNFKNSVSTIDIETKGISTLISDLLFEARLQYGDYKIEDISIKDIEFILKKVLDNLSLNNFNKVDLKVISNIKNKNNFIKANKIHIERIFNNLISNSIKYTKEGDIKVTLEEYKSRMKNNLRIIVEDTGIGIKKEDLNKVSERFFRGKNIENEIAGTGIGLAIVKDIVKGYDWNFKILSEEKVGTKVEITKIHLF